MTLAKLYDISDELIVDEFVWKLTLIVDQSNIVWYTSALSWPMSKRLIISTITKSSCKPLNSKHEDEDCKNTSSAHKKSSR